MNEKVVVEFQLPNDMTRVELRDHVIKQNRVIASLLDAGEVHKARVKELEKLRAEDFEMRQRLG